MINKEQTLKTIEAWHWLREDRCLAYPPRELVTAGSVFVDPRDEFGVTGEISLCNRGYHASVRAIDALKYAPGAVICRVVLSGEILVGDDKLCASVRKTLWIADATTELHRFACDVAEKALVREREHSRNADPRCWNAIEVKRKWIDGAATDEELAAAWAAARAAARDAAWAAARAAARAAAWAAARAAARDAAWAAAWDDQNQMLEKRLWTLQPKT